MLATDWSGMSKYDLLPTLKAFMSNASDLRMLPERLQQGFINKMLSLRLLREHLLTEDFLKSRAGDTQLLTQDTKFAFYGISQGA